MNIGIVGRPSDMNNIKRTLEFISTVPSIKIDENESNENKVIIETNLKLKELQSELDSAFEKLNIKSIPGENIKNYRGDLLTCIEDVNCSNIREIKKNSKGKYLRNWNRTRFYE
jgi:hypothetical protein